MAAVEEDWQAAPPVAAPPPAWNQQQPKGASALEQLESLPPEPEPGAAAKLFAPLPAGASLAGDEEELPEPAASRAGDNEAMADVASEGNEMMADVVGEADVIAEAESDVDIEEAPVVDDDPDLLVPVPEEEPRRPREPPPAPVGAMGRTTVGVSPLLVPGEHRVAVHTRAGRTRRGTVKDVDLSKASFALLPQGGGESETIYHAEVKAIFFMLAPGEKAKAGSGGRVRVMFADGRTVDGQRDGTEGRNGFFFVPGDAQRTNTRRIYVAREALTDVKDL